MKVGLWNERRALGRELEQIELRNVIPEAHPFRRSLGTFSSSEELEPVVTRLRDEVLPFFAKPLWDDIPKLRDLLDQLEQSHAEEVREGTHENLHRIATNAFNEGRYGEAIESYERIGKDLLSQSESRRLEIARKRLGGVV